MSAFIPPMIGQYVIPSCDDQRLMTYTNKNISEQYIVEHVVLSEKDIKLEIVEQAK